MEAYKKEVENYFSSKPGIKKKTPEALLEMANQQGIIVKMTDKTVNPYQLRHAAENSKMQTRQARLGDFIRGIERTVKEVGDLFPVGDKAKNTFSLYEKDFPGWKIEFVPEAKPVFKEETISNGKAKLQKVLTIGVHGQWSMAFDAEGRAYIKNNSPIIGQEKFNSYRELCTASMDPEQKMRSAFSLGHLKLSGEDCEALKAKFNNDNIGVLLAKEFEKTYKNEKVLDLPITDKIPAPLRKKLIEFSKNEEGLKQARENIARYEYGISESQAKLSKLQEMPDSPEKIRAQESIKNEMETTVGLLGTARANLDVREKIANNVLPISELMVHASQFLDLVNTVGYETRINPDTKNLEIFFAHIEYPEGSAWRPTGGTRLSSKPLLTIDATNISPAARAAIEKGQVWRERGLWGLFEDNFSCD